jgi:hypothetical protein
MESEKRELQKLKAELDAAENPQGRGPFGDPKENPFDKVSSRHDKRNDFKTRGKIARIKRAIENKERSVKQRTKDYKDIVEKQNPTKKDNRSARQKRIDAKKAGHDPFAGAKGAKGGKGSQGSKGYAEGSKWLGRGRNWVRGDAKSGQKGHWVEGTGPTLAERRGRDKGNRGSSGIVGTAGLPGRAIVGRVSNTGKLKQRADELRNQQKRNEELFNKAAKKRRDRSSNPQTKPTIGPPGNAFTDWWNRPSGPAGYDNPKHRNYDKDWHTKYPSVKDARGNIRRPSSDEINKAETAEKAERQASAQITYYERRQNAIRKAQSENSSGGVRWLALQTDLEAIQKKGTKQYNIMKQAQADIVKITNGRGYQVNSNKVYDKKKGTSGPKGPKGILGIDGTTNQVEIKPGGDQY